MDRIFPPTRAASLDRLAEFTPRMGRQYAAGRNSDAGEDAEPTVSMLSPYVRRRLLLESELVLAARDAHGAAAEKFVQEVFWRGYFKGFLESHPMIWDAFHAGLSRDRNRLATEEGLRRAFHDATEGRTGIDCFDAWARELVATNWLHNHVRMWFASIWIFTLRLPWTLGAAFFLRHLLDGDPASNTLSWRWVAGLHTRGKNYVARADNIARYTDGRFNPAGQLDESPEPLREDHAPTRVPLTVPDALPDGPVCLLLHDEECCPELLEWLPPDRVARIGALRRSPSDVAEPVARFAADALADATARAESCFRVSVEPVAEAELAQWIAASPHPVVTPSPAIGPVADLLHRPGVLRPRRRWDSAVWPHATAGFFQVKDRIPRILRDVAIA